VIFSVIHWQLRVRNFIQICSDFTFLYYTMFRGLLFSGHSVVLTSGLRFRYFIFTYEYTLWNNCSKPWRM